MARKPLSSKHTGKIASAKKVSAKKKQANRKPSAVKKKTSVKRSKPTRVKPTPKKKRPVATAKKKTAVTLEAELKRLDHEILKLINKRASATTKLLESRTNPQEALFTPRADDDLWQHLESTNPGPLSSSAVRGVFREIISAARRRVRTIRVAYLGPPFSFTHLAAIERFGKSADLSPVNTIASVFEEVNRGHANYGLVPIENSTDGRVIDTLDMFNRLPLRICGEVQISVHHNLLACCQRGEITEIYSKPQAFSQCRDWLAKNMPHARLIEVTSTSTAAQLARDKPGAAAVASRQAAVEYGLQLIADDIEDNTNNVTRFAVIGEEVSKYTGKDRTAVLLHIPHKSGSLSDSLLIFKKNKVNLTWIESFPLRGPERGYQFFLDFEGHVSDERTKRTLSELEKHAVRLSVLGSYPRSEPLS